MHGPARAIIQDIAHYWKPLILVLRKTNGQHKRLISLIFKAIVLIGEGSIHLHDPTAQLL